VELDRPDLGHSLSRRGPDCCHLSHTGHSKAYATAYVSIRQTIDVLRRHPSRRDQRGGGHPNSTAMRPRPEAMGPERAGNLRTDQDMFAGGLSPRDNWGIRGSAVGLLSHLHILSLAPGTAGQDWPVSYHGRWRNV